MKVIVCILSAALSTLSIRMPSDSGFLSYYDLPLPADTEAVMTKGMRIVAQTTEGRIEVLSGAGTARHYFWKGGDTTVRMSRNNDYHAVMSGLVHWPSYGFAWERDPNSNLTCRESRLNFDSLKTAYLWLADESKNKVYACRNDGLCIFYDQDIRPAISVVQVYVKGSKPQRLPSANDAQINIEGEVPIPNSTKLPADAGIWLRHVRSEFESFERDLGSSITDDEYIERG